MSRAFATTVVLAASVLLPIASVTRAEPKGDSVHDPARAVANLDVHEGLEATLFASEPTILSPTNLDVDARGRVWICEVTNYRKHADKRPEGDRILILEDIDGDGVADKTKVFYQGKDVDSAMGICVLDGKVLVTCSPNVIVFYDEDGDDKPDRQENLFTKTGVAQHDHSAHSFVFGPDGRLYWNHGNTGKHVHDKDGKPVVDIFGNTVVADGNPYRQGQAFRCNLDGGDFEVLGHNFRNNYEATVDAFGTVWQSDNDDDGNLGTRINYVMEYGNYGYTDEMTGAGWRKPRTGMHPEKPWRHWHARDPGVVPNVVRTGNGSPSGITIYEGDLLPAVFHNQMLHCEPGQSVVRAYPVKPDGAGYAGRIVKVLEGTRNQWFRPADVSVAPDGSIFVTDWYDPGVGGHAMGDLGRGRIFRLAPPGHRYNVPEYDYQTAAGATQALTNPNFSVRFTAWTTLHNMGGQAETALATLLSSNNPRHKARALWLLGRIDGRGEHYVKLALADPDADIRIVGLRLARQLKLDMTPLVKQMLQDPAPSVRRECLIALHRNPSPEAASLWAELALQHDGEDRWYVEALGIAAATQWDAFLDAWLARVGDRWNSPAGRDVIWRSRAAKTPRYLRKILQDPSTPTSDLPRYLRAFDFQNGGEKHKALVELAFGEHATWSERETLVAFEAMQRLGPSEISKAPERAAVLDRLIERTRGSGRFIVLVDQFNVTSRYDDVLAVALQNPDSDDATRAIRLLLDKDQGGLIQRNLEGSVEPAVLTAKALQRASDDRTVDMLLAVVKNSEKPLELRLAALRAAGARPHGLEGIVELAKQENLDEELKPVAAAVLHHHPRGSLAEDVARLFPVAGAKDNRPLPTVRNLTRMQGDVERGKVIFHTTGTCVKCHVVGKEGKEVGPNLSETGAKLSRQALFESILFPSAAISHNYEAYTVALKSGEALSGVLLSETDAAIILRDSEAVDRTVPTADILAKEKQNISLMPADLHKGMTAQELVDLVEFLQSLRGTPGK